MSTTTTLIVRLVIFALAGALIALLVGLATVMLAPKDGFGDLAAAALTTVFLIPLGLATGGVFGWWSRPKSTDTP